MNTINKHYITVFTQNIFLYFVVLSAAFCLKLHYSRAASDDLTWILKPTAEFVEYVTDIHFVKSENAGFINREHRILIAPSCAGVNFLIMAFCMSSFSSLHQPGFRRKKIFRLIACGLSSYLLTILVNTIRITAAIYLYKYCVSWGWFTSDRIHRIEGIVVYFVFLFIFYRGIQKVISKNWKTKEKKVRYKNDYAKSRTICLPAGWTPLSWYLAITLGIPLLNSAYLKNFARFAEHFIMVIFVSTILLLIITWFKRYIMIRADD